VLVTKFSRRQLTRLPREDIVLLLLKGKASYIEESLLPDAGPAARRCGANQVFCAVLDIVQLAKGVLN